MRVIRLSAAALVVFVAALVPGSADHAAGVMPPADGATGVFTVHSGPVTAPAPGDPAATPSKVEAGLAAEASRTAPAAPTASGMIAAIDPATGRIGRPSAAQRAAVERARTRSALGSALALDRSDVGLEVVRLPDGAEMVRLEGRFMEHVIARVDASGRIVTDCAQGPDVADRLAGDGAPVRVEE